MARLLILFVAILLVAILFFSRLEKTPKYLLASAVVFLTVVGLWWETAATNPRNGIIEATQLRSCGLGVSHSYRTNFDIELCVDNTHESASVRRFDFTLAAYQCGEGGDCSLIQQVTKSRPITIAPQSQVQIIDNMEFGQVEPDATTDWRVSIHDVLGVR
ncbi:MAG: hypothetical protein AAF197_11790 [Pseudomonadota bacterium]